MPPNNILLILDQDIKMMNRYRLSYHCNTVYQDRKVAKENFIKLAEKLYPEQSTAIK